MRIAFLLMNVDEGNTLVGGVWISVFERSSDAFWLSALVVSDLLCYLTIGHGLFGCPRIIVVEKNPLV
jgi:hypothetical protein